MNIEATITNQSLTAQNHLIMQQYPGDPASLHEGIKEHMTLKEAESLEQGDVIYLADGEISVFSPPGFPNPLVVQE